MKSLWLKSRNYDAEEVYGAVGKLLVSSRNLDQLSNGATQLIAQSLHLKSCTICIDDVDPGPLKDQKIYSSDGQKLDSSDTKEASVLAAKVRSNVIIADELGPNHKRLREILTSNDIAVLIRFSSTDQKGSLGYIALGSRQDGKRYSKQDLRFLDAVAKELIIGIQNAVRFEQIQRFNLTLQEKVAEATKQLRDANKRLKLLDETKDDFISMASHQLRTPLTSIKGYLSMVLDGDAGKLNETQREMLHQSFVSSQRMVYLVSDLLNVSRLNTGKFVVTPSRINLTNVVAEEIDQLQDTAATHKIKLTYKRPLKFPDVLLDEAKLRQVIMNFIDNAIYYSPTGSEVEILLQETANAIELRVKDKGIGVPKAEQYRLFTKFYRAANARRARPDGTGLGLFMAKKAIVAQGGAIIFSSVEGKGSTFGFSFAKSKIVVRTIDYTL